MWSRKHTTEENIHLPKKKKKLIEKSNLLPIWGNGSLRIVFKLVNTSLGTEHSGVEVHGETWTLLLLDHYFEKEEHNLCFGWKEGI